jgi:hypothetical protein
MSSRPEQTAKALALFVACQIALTQTNSHRFHAKRLPLSGKSLDLNPPYVRPMWLSAATFWTQLRNWPRLSRLHAFINQKYARQVGEAGSSGFLHHIKNDHNMWKYLFFQVYLRERSYSEYSGTPP